MTKLKNNQGYTLSIVLVIMVTLAILTSSILFTVTLKSNTSTNVVENKILKIDLEKHLYLFLNNVVTTQEEPTTETIDSCHISVFAQDNVYNIEVTKTNENLKLIAQITFSNSFQTYEIIMLGYK